MDRVSQLQDVLDKTVQDFASALLELQHGAPPVMVDASIPVTFVPDDIVQTQTASTAAILDKAITNMTTSINHSSLLIDSLPGVHLNEAQQMDRLRELDRESKDADADLEAAVAETMAMMRKLQEGIEEVAVERR
ncbi:hypothetical protein HKX48_004281 [Thoreauomyces humboldtii]|nr:hypothetical protein HKX48_004281 [Thoreauomyces humboldtii]